MRYTTDWSFNCRLAAPSNDPCARFRGGVAPGAIVMLPSRPVNIGPESRRFAMLSRVLGVLCVLVGATSVALVVDSLTFDRRWSYAAMVTGLLAVLVVAFLINRAGRYQAAGWLTVAVAYAGPWGSALIDSTILSGDLLPLCFVVMPIMLSSILLSTAGTAFVGTTQFVALLVAFGTRPESNSENWASLLSLVVFVSMLCVAVNQLTLADREQIRLQTLRLEDYAATLREQTVRDGLTGLFNRRYLEETLERELARAERHGSTIGVIMLDLDGFKSFNDSRGHLAGDSLLRDVGALLREHVRLSDVACRYGGDEFTLVLLDAGQAIGNRAAGIFEAAKVMLEAARPRCDGLGVSFGVATYPKDGKTRETLLKAADAALYAAKRAGRGRIAFANPVG